MSTDTIALQELLLSLADDELILGHRDSEWTGYAPILEEDIAFSNIAQDEIGHSLVWFTILEHLTMRTPDQMAFEREAKDFRCCRFVEYQKGDFAYTVVRQYLFDEAEQVRLESLKQCSYAPIKGAASKIILEESYHLLHTKGLVQRLGDGTEESHHRMQQAVDVAFGQAKGIFEPLTHEDELAGAALFPRSEDLFSQWIQRVVPVLTSATLLVPETPASPVAPAEYGGRRGNHTEHLSSLLDDMHSVYRLAPGAHW